MAALAAAEKSSLLDPPPSTFPHQPPHTCRNLAHWKAGWLQAVSGQHKFHNPPSHVSQTTLVPLPPNPDERTRSTFPRRLRKTHPRFSLNRLLKRDFMLIAQWQAKIPHNLRAICPFYHRIDFSRLKETESRPLCPQKGKLMEKFFTCCGRHETSQILNPQLRFAQVPLAAQVHASQRQTYYYWQIFVPRSHGSNILYIKLHHSSDLVWDPVISLHWCICDPLLPPGHQILNKLDLVHVAEINLLVFVEHVFQEFRSVFRLILNISHGQR